ncbi:hypothetical protein BKA62DRAFT_509053 [Auriculariales sp. MPI-PUGE-AT-0066]|nr:hypothetical protein BKA62DRAFT_509053 [Auriculariales sp. MPI-PUGE-AT-0066]
MPPDYTIALPAELISSILDWLPDVIVVKLGQVNRRWRTVAQAHADYSQTVDFCVMRQHAMLPSFQLWTQRLKRLQTTSMPIRLRVVVRGFRIHDDNIPASPVARDLFAQISEVGHLLASLDLMLQALDLVQVAFRELRANPAPILRHLRIGLLANLRPIDWPQDLFAGSIPRIGSLEVFGLTLPDEAVASLQCIRKLTLWSQRSLNVKKLTSVLFPKLDTLSIKETNCEAGERTFVRTLKSLQVNGDKWSEVQSVLNAFKLDSITSLHVISEEKLPPDIHDLAKGLPEGLIVFAFTWDNSDIFILNHRDYMYLTLKHLTNRDQLARYFEVLRGPLWSFLHPFAS